MASPDKFAKRKTLRRQVRVVETFATTTTELERLSEWLAGHGVTCIEKLYNRQRLHSALGYRTPAEARASMEALTMHEAA